VRKNEAGDVVSIVVGYLVEKERERVARFLSNIPSALRHFSKYAHVPRDVISLPMEE
jgi:hypothetical protein